MSIRDDIYHDMIVKACRDFAYSNQYKPTMIAVPLISDLSNWIFRRACVLNEQLRKGGALESYFEIDDYWLRVVDNSRLAPGRFELSREVTIRKEYIID